jgi:hypothetical protein
MVFGATVKALLILVASAAGLYGSLWLVAGVWDGSSVAARIGAAKDVGGVMQCADGKLIYDDDLLFTRLTTRGRFVCTEWKITDGPDRR